MIFTRCSSPVWNVPEQQKSRLLGRKLFSTGRDGTKKTDGGINVAIDKEGGNRRSCEDTVT